jgi:hypothetical protein
MLKIPVATELATTGNVVIANTFFDGTDNTESQEHVIIRNGDTRPIQL